MSVCLYTLRVCSHAHTQAYLKEFNELYEELKGKNVGIFAICAEDTQAKADQAVREWGLQFKVCHPVFRGQITHLILKLVLFMA